MNESVQPQVPDDGQDSRLKCVVKSPRECSELELSRFHELVKESGEVAHEGLQGRIAGAAGLVFLIDAEVIVGVAGLKRPNLAYRKRVSEAAGVSLSEVDFPYELGWVYIRPVARGRKGTPALVRGALDLAGGSGVYATSATDKGTMHHWLRNAGFQCVGKPYSSAGREICLFVRPGHAQSSLGKVGRETDIARSS